MNKKLKSKLKEIAKRYDLLLFVFFGSRIQENYTKDSDYDFAFLNDKKISQENYQKIKKDIYNVIKNPNIDLIDLNRNDDPVLRYEVLNNGLCVYEKYDGVFETAQTDSWFNYVYYKPIIEEQKEFVKKSLMDMDK